LGGKVEKERVVELNASEALAVLDKLVNHCKDNTWTKKQAKNISVFVKSRGGEQLVYFWNAVSKTQKLPNIQALHGQIGQDVVRLVRDARGLSTK
jgi:site-specific recombinase XerD